MFQYTNFAAINRDKLDKLVARKPSEGEKVIIYLNSLFVEARAIRNISTIAILYKKISETIEKFCPWMPAPDSLEFISIQEMTAYVFQNVLKNLVMTRNINTADLFAIQEKAYLNKGSINKSFSNQKRKIDPNHFICNNCTCGNCVGTSDDLHAGFCIKCNCQLCNDFRIKYAMNNTLVIPELKVN